MKYATLNNYNFTVGYYSAINTDVTGQSIPVWQYTFIKDIKVALASDISQGRITMYSPEELSLNYVVKNFRDANGTSFLNAPSNQLGIDTSSWLIYAVVPQLNLFGYLDGFKITLQQLNGARAI